MVSFLLSLWQFQTWIDEIFHERPTPILVLVSRLTYLLILNMEAIRCSETSSSLRSKYKALQPRSLKSSNYKETYVHDQTLPHAETTHRTDERATGGFKTRPKFGIFKFLPPYLKTNKRALGYNYTNDYPLFIFIHMYILLLTAAISNSLMSRHYKMSLYERFYKGLWQRSIHYTATNFTLDTTP